MNDVNDVLDSWSQDDMLEIELVAPDDFLKVKETLSRIGVASTNNNTLYQSCHILHKHGRYFIMHFKEMFLLDGKPSNFTIEDLGRRNSIAILLEDWGLLKIVSKNKITNVTPIKKIKVIKYSEKAKWNLQAKYSIGVKS